MATKKSNNKKPTSNTSKSTSAKATAKTKQPLLSTKRKVGIAVYFTFLATLALSFGIQVWLLDTFNPPATTEPNFATNEEAKNSNTQTNEVNKQEQGSNIERALLENEQATKPEQSNNQQEFITPAEDDYRFNLLYPDGTLIENYTPNNYQTY